MITKNKFATLATLLVASVGLAIPASSMAATTGTSYSQLSLTSGQLTLVTPPIVSSASDTITGAPQTAFSNLEDYVIDDATGSGNGWNLAVQGASETNDTGGLLGQLSAVGTAGSGLGSNTGSAYVNPAPPPSGANGFQFPVGSVVYDSSNDNPATGTGARPTLECNAGCDLDGTTSTIIDEAALNAGLGTWTSNDASSDVTWYIPSNAPAATYQLVDNWSLTTGP